MADTQQKILVPLDGSSLAESALTAATRLARKINATVTLFHAIEREAPERIHGETHLTKPEQAEAYLRSVAAKPMFNKIPVRVHIHETGVRDVSQSISDHSEELSADMIVMCTHGSTGLHNLLVGTIAQQVLSLTRTPVLMANASVLNSEYKFTNFLAPLDGNPDHEQALRHATELAKICNAKIHLLVAVPRFGTMRGELTAADRFLPGTSRRMMDMAVPQAKEYLGRIKSDIERGGVQVTTNISRSNPAAAILKTSKNTKSDLIVLGTHGMKGSKPFWEGSITPKVIRSSKVPILLVPVRE